MGEIEPHQNRQSMSAIRSILLLTTSLVLGATALAQVPGQVSPAPQGSPTIQRPAPLPGQPSPASISQPVNPTVPAQAQAPQRPASPPPVDSRENPFLTSTTSEEERRIADRERMRSVVREMFPEMRSMMQPDMATLRQQLTDDTKKQMADALAKVPAIAPSAPASPQPPGSAAKSAAKLPEKAKFIGCVNGKALYRDGNQGYNFFWTGPEAEVFGCIAP
ncbi:hypothetical protein BSY19_4918 (plasmid) [Bosea sp. RAC05]|nr:hypothetical protein BSY19_4918 [Bosea sp. RAC05]